VSALETWKARARRLTREVYALSFAVRDPRVPWYAKVAAACVVAYALSPIDLIPDFIPVLGYLDDLVLVPLGVWLVLRLIPAAVLSECRARADRCRAHVHTSSSLDNHFRPVTLRTDAAAASGRGHCHTRLLCRRAEAQTTPAASRKPAAVGLVTNTPDVDAFISFAEMFLS